MSHNIWAKCEKYGAVPFYGYPVIPKVEDGMIIYEFPEGYTPNGNQMQEVADDLLEQIGSSIVEVTDKTIKVMIDNKLLALFICEHQQYIMGPKISEQESHELIARSIIKEIKSCLKE
jgi:hypothetical protein